LLSTVKSEISGGISPGDLEPAMIACCEDCVNQRNCNQPQNTFQEKAPFYLHLTFWDCLGMFGLWVIQHWYYMLVIEFDYTYNMIIGVLNGVFQTFAWVIWYFCCGRYDGREYANKIVLGYSCLWLAATMELLDFPPVFFLVDPHSLWHLGTVPLAYLLWNFYVADGIFEDNKKHHLG